MFCSLLVTVDSNDNGLQTQQILMTMDTKIANFDDNELQLLL